MALLQTPAAEVGVKLPSFELSDPAGVRHSHTSLMGSRGLLVMFICNHCPYVLAVIDRLVGDVTALSQEGIGVVAIMPNDYARYPDDAPNKMQAFAQHHEFTFPYLVDEDQSVAKAFDAVCTPDFFGYNAAGELAYRGRIDDTKMGDASNRSPELVKAMLAVAQSNQAPAVQHPSMGCSIKWK